VNKHSRTVHGFPLNERCAGDNIACKLRDGAQQTKPRWVFSMPVPLVGSSPARAFLRLARRAKLLTAQLSWAHLPDASETYHGGDMLSSRRRQRCDSTCRLNNAASPPHRVAGQNTGLPRCTYQGENAAAIATGMPTTCFLPRRTCAAASMRFRGTRAWLCVAKRACFHSSRFWRAGELALSPPRRQVSMG